MICSRWPIATSWSGASSGCHPDQRAILVLHHYEGYAPTEIAEILGIPPGTARSRLHHAHRAMRAALDADARLATAGGQSA